MSTNVARQHALWGALCLVVAFCGCGGRERQETATLVIESAPVEGAEVTVDGTPYGPTPATIRGLPAPGSVVVVLEKEGFERAAESIDIPAGGGAVERTIELEPLVGYVTFNSDPPSAQVFLDGQTLLGTTPLSRAEVPVGDHSYELRLENYQSIEEKIHVDQDYVYTRTHELKPKPAELSVFSKPSRARVWLNEEPQPERTPARFSLIPGTYTVSVRAKGFIMAEKSIELGPNEKRNLELAMQPGQAPPGMVLVPAGKFIMGADDAAPDERPQHVVELDAFYIDKYEVTNEQYKQVFPDYVFPEGEGRYPVTGVSFDQATQYAERVGKRLPTEAEWEKAARGSDGREYPWGNEFDKTKCNCNISGLDEPTRVGSYRGGASPYGCMDIAGNVYEWTSSWYKAYPGNIDVTKDYGQIFRVLRGGSYRSSPFEVRCVRRHYDRMDKGRPDYGFRCVKDIAVP